MGYLFMKTYDATSGDELADINAAIWRVTHSGLKLSGNALTLYNEAKNQTGYTEWYGKMNILTPELLADDPYASQEYLVQAPVPEPAALFLLGTDLLGLAGIGRKKLKR